MPINFLVHQVALAVKEGLDGARGRRTRRRCSGWMTTRVHLALGLDADVVIWSGDSLDVLSRASRVFVQGREVYSYDERSGNGVVAPRWYQENGHRVPRWPLSGAVEQA